MGGQVALHGPRFHGVEPREGDGVVGVLLEQRGDESGGIKAGFHTSKAADFSGALASLLVEKCSDIPRGRGGRTGADEDAAFLGEGRCRSCGAETNAVELD